MKVSAVIAQKGLPNNVDYIRRKAFGNNVDGTCTAVATAICMRYLDLNVQDCVSGFYESENLFGSKFDSIGYRQAEVLHQDLVNHHNIGVASYALAVRNGVEDYVNDHGYESTGLSVSWLKTNSIQFVTDHIDTNRPCMMTTTAFTAPKEWDWHTMAIYGYRKYDNGTCEYMVHTGWYGDDQITNNVANVVWLPSSYAYYEYKVNINNP